MEEFIFGVLEGFPTIALLFVIAFFLWSLGKGADIVVDNSVELSIRWGVPKVVVGATIVSIGTTLPEATISVLGAINGSSGLALGNAIGSIITDTGLIMGLSAVIGLVPTSGKIVKRQGKFQLWAVILLAVSTIPFAGIAKGGVIYQFTGFAYVVLLVLYVIMSVRLAKRDGDRDEDESEISNDSMWLIIVKLFFAIFLVIVSSRILIPAIRITAVRAHIPEGIIASTLVAFGTSLPELVTSVTAVRKGHGQLAIGNVIGADILNVLFVVGLSAAVTTDGLMVPSSFYYVQIPFMLLIVLTFRYNVKRSKEHISKKGGYFLLGMYVLYLILSYILK